MKRLLLKCTMNVQLMFNGQLFRQIDGVAIGSLLGQLLADLFVSKLEREILSDMISIFRVYARYMDDILIICDQKISSEEIILGFNRAHKLIMFTCELEKQDAISFLDVLLSRRTDETIKCSIYRKPTWSGQYTHFHSFVPLHQKRNLVECLTSKAERICTEDLLPIYS